jgi:HEAT repeat protein
MWNRLGTQDTPWTVARDETLYPLARLLETADAVGRDAAETDPRTGLRDADNGVRYWAAVGLHARPSLNTHERQALREALKDASPVVRIEAAAALARHDEPEAALPVLIAALEDDSLDVTLHAARALELLGSKNAAALPSMRTALARARAAEAGGNTIAMFIGFSLEAALRR